MQHMQHKQFKQQLGVNVQMEAQSRRQKLL
jgi:hypothetical protein